MSTMTKKKPKKIKKSATKDRAGDCSGVIEQIRTGKKKNYE